MRYLLSALLTALLIFAAGCSDPQSDEVDHGVAWARRLLERSKTDLLAGVSFQSSIESGGTPLDYIAANSQPEGLPSYVWGGPPAPFTVVIRPGENPGDIVIEGYKEDLAKPALTETVTGVGSPRK